MLSMPSSSAIKEIEQDLGLPVITVLGDIKTTTGVYDGPNRSDAILTSRFDDAIRHLRTHIEMTCPKGRGNVIQLTATSPGEGKTTIVCALASAAAAFGDRVLLIDSCIRHPGLTYRLSYQGKPGLKEVLTGEKTLSDVVIYSPVLKCMFLPGGQETDNVADLLSSERLRWVLGNARSLFKLSVIDSPPVSRTIDPIILSELSDEIVYVVRWDNVARESIRRALFHLSRYKKPIGIVINCFETVDKREVNLS